MDKTLQGLGGVLGRKRRGVLGQPGKVGCLLPVQVVADHLGHELAGYLRRDPQFLDCGHLPVDRVGTQRCGCGIVPVSLRHAPGICRRHVQDDAQLLRPAGRHGDTGQQNTGSRTGSREGQPYLLERPLLLAGHFLGVFGCLLGGLFGLVLHFLEVRRVLADALGPLVHEHKGFETDFFQIACHDR